MLTRNAPSASDIRAGGLAPAGPTTNIAKPFRPTRARVGGFQSILTGLVRRSQQAHVLGPRRAIGR